MLPKYRMPWKASVLNVVIASPSDVAEERNLIAKLIQDWNFVHGQRNKTLLEPIRWETHAHPELGDRAQGVVNRQIIDTADLLVGVFWTRLGTDTGVAPSGTAEEIQRFVDTGKADKVALYFSDRPVVMSQVDTTEYSRLKDFKANLQKQGLLGTFSDLNELKSKFSADLASKINSMIPRPPRLTRTRGAGVYDRPAALAAARKAVQMPPLIRGKRYTRNDIITNNGDVRILETWEDIVSFDGSPVSEIPVNFRSRAGRQANWHCKSLVADQSVEWFWEIGGDGTPEGRFVFDPPLRSKPVSFSTERYVVNGVAFTQLERLQATNGQETEEELRGTYRNQWKQCMFNIRFPEHRFPKSFHPGVVDSNGSPLEQERAFVQEHFKPWPEIQTLSFTLVEPLPDVQYSIRWELPDDSSSQLSTTESRFVEEVTQRLLGLRLGCATQNLVGGCLEKSRHQLFDAIPSASALSFSVSLFVYDRQKSGLVCVATLDAGDNELNWEKFFFKPGRGVAGRAFRRRALEFYCYAAKQNNHEIFEQVEGQGSPPAMVICVPIFLGTYRDRVMAILSFETVQHSEEVSDFFCRDSGAFEIETRFRNWYESQLAESVGTSGARSFWKIGQLTSTGTGT